MPTLVNGCGTRYAGRANVEHHPGICDGCGHSGAMANFDTRLWLTLVFVPAPLEQLAVQQQACGSHPEALRIFRHIMEELPNAAQKPAFRKLVTASARLAPDAEPALPRKEFRINEFLQGTPGKIAGGALFALLAMAGMAARNMWIASHRKEFRNPKVSYMKRKVYFINYNKADKSWARVIRDALEDAGKSTLMQEADFHAGSNFPKNRSTDRPRYVPISYT